MNIPIKEEENKFVSLETLNDFFNRNSVELLKSFQENCLINDMPKGKIEMVRSLPICLSSSLDGIKSQYYSAKKSMELTIYSIRRMGFKIIPIELYWNNVFDSDCNIKGDLGFYIMTFKLEKI